LFENRLKSGIAQLDEILKLNNLEVQEISLTERKKLEEELRMMHNQVKAFNPDLHGDSFDLTKIWKTHFTNALPLINKRRTFVADGYAYLFRPQLLNVLSQHFRTTLAGNKYLHISHLI
jgi:DNA primase large subunit